MSGGADRKEIRDGDLAPPPPRAATLSPPQPQDHSRVRALASRTAVYTLLQGAVWTALSLVAVLVYLGTIPLPESVTAPPVDIAQWDFVAILVNLYFRENAVVPDIPLQLGGMTSPRTVFILMAVTMVVNAAWFCSSVAMLATASPRVLTWAASTCFVTAVDVMLVVAMSRDLVLLGEWEEAYSDLKLGPALLLFCSLRAGILILTNVYCLLKLLRCFAKLRADSINEADQVGMTDREGPIDAFLYRNNSRDTMGAYNPVFIPDHGDPERRWTSFKPFQGAQDPPGRGAGADIDRFATEKPSVRRLRRIDADDLSHLSWMENSNRHVEVRTRSQDAQPQRPPLSSMPAMPAIPAPPAPPAHHRPGWQAPPPAAGLPRVWIDPDAPFPLIPRPDYTPPMSRATGKALQRMVQQRY